MLGHFNHGMDGAVPGGKPLGVGDIYYGQDLGRDFWFLLNSASGFKRMLSSYPALLSGGVVSYASAWLVNITEAYGLVDFPVQVTDGTVPWASLPVTRADVITAMAYLPAQVNFDVRGPGGYVANGSTTNYLYLKYAEDTPSNGNRNRQKGSGSYAYEQTPSFSLGCDTTNPSGDGSKLLLATLTITAAGVITIVSMPKKTLLNTNQTVPIGFVYWQGPGDASPATLWPDATWSNVSSEEAGLFRRAEGGAASTFNSGTQAGQNKSHTHTQSLAYDSPDHSHTYYWGANAGSGASCTPTGSGYSGSTSGASARHTHANVNIADGGTETRPDNITVRKWRRTA